MFPLNAVLYPGVSVPLHVFEDRYRALIHHLMRIEDPAERLFGSVAIREGYEVGDHGNQSLYRIGMRMQVTEIEPHADGTFDITAVGRDRIQLDRLLTTDQFPVGEVTLLDGTQPQPQDEVPSDVVERARATFTAYRHVLTSIAGDPLQGDLPSDPTYLSWTLAACTPLPMGERQQLLEASDTAERLILVTDLLKSELQAINIITSLPATQVARTRWSPN